MLSQNAFIHEYDFFVSYTQADRPDAEWIAWQLQEAGYRIFIQAWHIKPGSDFIVEMRLGLQKSERIIAVVSELYFQSSHCMTEWDTGHERDPDGAKRLLIPVMVKRCNVPSLDRRRVRIDIVDKDELTAVKLLLEGVDASAHKTKPKPNFTKHLSKIAVTPTQSPRFPGNLPPVWNVKIEPSPHFTGRRKEIDDIHKALQAPDATVTLTQRQVVHGGGGVGKTMLAIEYAWRYRSHYAAIFWTPAGTSEILKASIAGFASLLKLPEAQAPQDVIRINASKEWLTSNNNWLLIADNVDNADAAEALRELLKGITSGHILITSRFTKWPASYHCINVEKWDMPTAIIFLKKRLLAKPDLFAEADAEKLSYELDCLPLALEQAAAYVEDVSITIGQYLQRWTNEARYLASDGLPFGGGTDYDKTVASTWKVTEKELNPLSRAALALLGWLSPEAVPRSLFTEQSEFVVKVAQRFGAVTVDRPDRAVEGALVELSKYSLIKLEPQSITCHRLLQATQRWQYGNEFLELATDWIQGYLSKDPQPTNVRGWSRWEPLREGVATLLDFRKENHNQVESSSEAGRWLNQGFATFLQTRANYAAADLYFERGAVGVSVIESSTGRYLSVTKRVCAINFRTKEEMLKLTFKDVTYQDDLPVYLQGVEDLKAGKVNSYKLEKRNVRPDGSLSWVSLTVFPMWQPGESTLRYIEVIEDISERKQTELAYHRELAYNHALVSQISALIAVLDLQGRFVYVNSAFTSILGYSQKQIIGRTPWEMRIMDAQEISGSKECFARLLCGEKSPPIDLNLRTKDGKWRYVEIRSVTTHKPDGSLDRIVITGTDMTERNRLQQEVLRVLEEEQARVGIELHDGIGQSLTGIVSLVEALESDLMGDAKQQTQRIHEMLRQTILEIRRLAHGMSSTIVKNLGLVQALTELAVIVRTNFRTPCVCELDADITIPNNEIEAHLFRIAQEAVNNALRYGRPSQVRLSLKHSSLTECELVIEDDGAVMKKAKEFQQGGIGLRVMDYRANLIGARLTVKSRPRCRRGMIVTCRFPFERKKELKTR